MAYSAMDVAKYIISKCTMDQHPISNLQLQKILYYVQKKYLQDGSEAFRDEIEAWQFGPVVPEVYYKYCGFGSMPIRMTYTVIVHEFDKMIINPIVELKRMLSPWDMVEETHRPGKAWAMVYRGGAGNHGIIPKDLIRTRG